MAENHPETLPVTADGVRLGFGSRQQYCPSSPKYRERSAALARALADRFADHSGVVMWHINNEYACHVHECFCDVCRVEFQKFAEARYANIDALNQAWGTAFWAQRYSQFSEINVPGAMPTFANPAQMLDWRRFSNKQILGCMLGEIAEIRAISDKPITTNFMGAFVWLDYREWAQHLDLISDDHYPDPSDPAAGHDIAWQADVMRGLGDGAPWLLMEQVNTAVQWRGRNSPKRPGQYEMWSIQRVAHGADGILQFQWRQSHAGAETYHGGMVGHAGKASKAWHDVTALGAQLSRLAPVMGTRSTSEVAIVIDWESEWAQMSAVGPAERTEHFAEAKAWHRTLWEQGVATDVIGPDDSLDGYRVVIVPELWIDRPALADRARAFAEAGGHVVVTHGTSVSDENLRAVLGGYLGSFKELLGVQVVEHALLSGPDYYGSTEDEARRTTVDRLSRAVGTPGAETWVGLEATAPALDRAAEAVGASGLGLRGGMWAEQVIAAIPSAAGIGVSAADGSQRYDRDLPYGEVILGFATPGKVGEADIIASFDGRSGGADLAGMPAITRRFVSAPEDSDGSGVAGSGTAGAHGAKGQAWYIATDLDSVSRAAFWQLLSVSGRVQPVLRDLPDGIEAQRRGDFLFLLNHGDKSVQLSGVVGTDLISGQSCTGHVMIAPRSAMVVTPTT
jgi:beta-galactosidase